MANIDLALFDGSQVPEDTRAVAAAVRNRIPAFPRWTAEQAKPLREARREGRNGFPPIVRSPRAETISIPGPVSELVLRAIAPEAPKGAYLHIHGGGWFMGGADLQDHKLEALADEAEVACISVEYRLAPEHPYPAPVDDCIAAASWLILNAATRWNTDRLVIGGDSAGAHLAALTLLALRDTAKAKFSCAQFDFGFFDLSLTPGARQFGSERSRPRTADLRGYVDAFVGGNHDLESPAVSPLYADLSNLCPAIFVVGTEDALLEDTLFMHSRWLAAGNSAELHIYPGAPHNFVALPCRAASDARDKASAFIRHHLSH